MIGKESDFLSSSSPREFYPEAGRDAAKRYLELLERYSIPEDTFAATRVWLSAMYGLWASAEDEAILWAWAWREFKAGRRRGWMPDASELSRAKRELG